MPQYASISTPSIIIPTLLLLLIIITCKSHELIGFIYGPSSQLFATKQQIIQANLLSRILSNNESLSTTTTTITTTVTTWMARIATTAEQIYNPHYELAYQHDCKTCILHDAGVIAALFAILHACNFFGDTISKRQQQQQQQRRRFHYFFMAGALFILPEGGASAAEYKYNQFLRLALTLSSVHSLSPTNYSHTHSAAMDCGQCADSMSLTNRLDQIQIFGVITFNTGFESAFRWRTSLVEEKISKQMQMDG
eukprot:scaffold460_cov81-Skeletonema_menzelii.AAC.8